MGRTVDGALELLAADLALQVANAELLVELHGDRLLVVAEEAGKGRRKRVGLSCQQRAVPCMVGEDRRPDSRQAKRAAQLTFLGP